ncbi:ParB/RepB/Spo0J family partition protein [Helicobacter sp. 13S00477-4]|uniref:ParB/RepB/Spo0J family partition protein n=1 Tax=Helicobacter sp. 13S00477-4 TaxID=1905759 RepID=UPI000BC9F3C9|nr:ParB/RepB/Spo0J family partition protein [Helicobacter sp. 13S00477-4]PAF52736.1 chromosome partitioning protein ParB [Helicobacter sp. 13S00477-4]
MILAKKNLALGRGLGAILSEVGQAYENNLSDNSELVVELDVDIIKPNPYQPRKHFINDSVSELSESIAEHGLLQPILVYEDEKNDYILIAGERRLRATKLANLKTIKAIIANIDTIKLREIALIENIQREELNPIDLANSYKELIDDYQITHDELAKKIKKSRTQITNTLRLLNLSLKVQGSLIEGKISQGHAKILITLDKDQQEVVLESILGQKLSVRDTESLVHRLKKPLEVEKSSNVNKKTLINETEKIKLKKIFQGYHISSSFKGNHLILNISEKSQIDELIDKLSLV